jgi:hypothetical protein
MNAFSRIGVVVTACYLLISGPWMQAQRGAGGGRQGGSAAPVQCFTRTDIKLGDAVRPTVALKNGPFTVLRMGISEQAAAVETRDRPTQGLAAPPGPMDAPPGSPYGAQSL